jgi:hypothetical protein
MSVRRVAAIAGAGVIIALGALAAGPSSPVRASTVSAAATASSSAFTKSETITRDHLITDANGTAHDDVVDTRNFSVNVSQTQGLAERQSITVSWSGAHPTGGIVEAQNTDPAADQEYPVVILECRGLDSTAVPSAQQLSPETCFTHTPAERYEESDSLWPSFRMDRYAPAAQRDKVVGAPSPFPSGCATPSGSEHWVPFVAANGTDYPGGLDGCGGAAPEEVVVEQNAQPDNTTFGTTHADGTGSIKFPIDTAESNASLGCSDTVQCSLVIIPIMGISCDTVGAGLPADDQPPADAATQAGLFASCSSAGIYKPGQFNSNFPNPQSLPVTGRLWWSASNWRNRISVPLTILPSPDACNSSDTSAPTYLYGSELMNEATSQWEPAFCLTPGLFKIQQVLTSEPEAKNLLSQGSVEAAIQGEPPDTPFSTPTVQSPLAATGWVVAFDIVDKSGNPITQLNLTPRLLAKLLTESYPATPDIRNYHPGLGSNPLSIAQDPEFQALNPTVPKGVAYTLPASTLYSLSTQSDAIWALTAYINADPAARAWLNGTPDPWGMVVNPAYKGLSLPVNRWPLLDSFNSGPTYDQALNPCLNTTPLPILQQIAAPAPTFAAITLNMQFEIANSQVVCLNPGVGQKLTAIGPESPGSQFLLAFDTYADAVRYGLPVASLQSDVSPSAPAKFTDSTGRTFVAPSDSSLAASARLLKPDTQAGTWMLPYSDFETDSAATGAYPGFMLMSADVPTSGLPSADAANYGAILNFAATSGQTPGTANGDLPGGYVPMTTANGFGPQIQYAALAAAAIKSQSGTVPSLTQATGGQGGSKTTASTGKPSTKNSSNTASQSLAVGGDGGTSGAGSSATSGTSDGSTTGALSGAGGPNGAADKGASGKGGRTSPSGTGSPSAQLASTTDVTAGLGTLAIPLAAGLAVIAMLVLVGRQVLGRR